MNTPPTLIALDWGSSGLRAYLMGAAPDGTGQVLATRSSEAGASRLAAAHAEARARGVSSDQSEAFEAALRAVAGDWLDAYAGLPVLASGMVGSAHGWHEAAYIDCPARLSELARHGVAVSGSGGLRVVIVPGVAWHPANAAPDVMRGEETQIAGVLAQHPQLAGAVQVVLPGTHSKWVDVQDGAIVAFATRMTGELFELLRTHSVLGRLMEPGAGLDAAAFVRGVQAGRGAQGADLLGQLFSVRTLGLFNQLPATALADYLSGLLIGHEIASALRAGLPERPLVLVGEATLCARYTTALQEFGITPAAVSTDAAPAGLWAVACAAR